MRWRIHMLGALSAGLFASHAGAQALAPAGVIAADALRPRSQLLPLQDRGSAGHRVVTLGNAFSQRRGSRRPYVLTGALIGAAAGGIYYWHDRRNATDGDFTYPYSLIALVGIGSVAGMAIGFAVGTVAER